MAWPIAPDSGAAMSPHRSRPVLAGAAAVLPLAFFLVGAVAVSAVAEAPSAVGAQTAFAVTVLAVVAAALVSALSVWLTDVTTRLMLTACGAATAAGTTYILLGQLSVTPLLSAPLAAIAGVAWGRWVVTVFALVRPSRAELIAGIPERDRIARSRAADPRSGDVVINETWCVDVASVRMQRLVVFGVVVFGAMIALSWGSAPEWWIVVLGTAGTTFCFAMAAWSTVRVRIDERGLTVTSLRLPAQLVRVRPEDVLGVASAEVDPMVWGGWGLRWNARHTAYISSGGPGLVIHRGSGRPLAIEIPEGTSVANAGAVLLRQVASRSRPA